MRLVIQCAGRGCADVSALKQNPVAKWDARKTDAAVVELDLTSSFLHLDLHCLNELRVNRAVGG